MTSYSISKHYKENSKFQKL